MQPPIVVEGLTATEEEEWVGLQEELEEEKLERESLFQRRAEIKEKIEQQSTEMEQQKRTNAELQAKVYLYRDWKRVYTHAYYSIYHRYLLVQEIAVIVSVI